jgi:hypothetical protein
MKRRLIFSTSKGLFSCVLNSFVNQDRFFHNQSTQQKNPTISVNFFVKENISKPAAQWFREK